MCVRTRAPIFVRTCCSSRHFLKGLRPGYLWQQSSERQKHEYVPAYQCVYFSASDLKTHHWHLNVCLCLFLYCLAIKNAGLCNQTKICQRVIRFGWVNMNFSEISSLFIFEGWRLLIWESDLSCQGPRVCCCVWGLYLKKTGGLLRLKVSIWAVDGLVCVGRLKLIDFGGVLWYLIPSVIRHCNIWVYCLVLISCYLLYVWIRSVMISN